MIPAFLIQRFSPTVAKVIFWGLALALVAVLLSVAKCTYDQDGKTRVKLSEGQAGAAVASGSDAVEAVGNQASRETAADAITKENHDAIENAAPPVAVPPALRDAGLRSLCRRRAYSGDPKCVQLTPAR